MPRKQGQASLNKSPLDEIRQGLGLDESSSGSRGNGYEVESVCVPCLSMLQGMPCQLDPEPRSCTTPRELRIRVTLSLT